MALLTCEAEIAAGRAQVLETLLDFDALGSFVPGVTACEVLESGQGTWEVRVSLDLIRTLIVTLRVIRDRDDAVRWSLVEGPLKTCAGAWRVEVTEIGTRATLSLEILFGVSVPGSLVCSLRERGLPAFAAAVKAEAERRAALSASVTV